MAWLIRKAQGVTTGDPAADAVDSLADPNQAQGTQPLPPDFGQRIGVWAIINWLAGVRYNQSVNGQNMGTQIKLQLINNPQASMAVNANGIALQDLGLQALNLNDPATQSALKIAGLDVNTIRPSDLPTPFQTQDFAAQFAPGDVQAQKAIALTFLPEGQGSDTNAQNWWKNLGARFQVLYDRAKQQTVQAPVAPPVAPAVTGSGKWAIKTAQAAPPPPMPAPAAPAMPPPPAQAPQAEQGGPLLSQQYQSPDELKADLQKLIAAQADPQKYNEMWSGILAQFEDPDQSSPESSDKEAAKEALTNYLQGGVGAFDFLWDLLVKNGKATALDNKIVGDVVENNPKLQKEQVAACSADAKVAYAGLFLPPLDSGLNTVAPMEKTAGGGVGGAGTGYGAYVMYGPEEKRMCPKLNNLVSTFICRYHCLDGLVIDDAQVLCGEAIWRGAMMDKFSREYQDKNGNWVGGYINKRFEVNYDDGGHPALLKPGTRSQPIHEDAWSLEKRLAEMRKDEGAAREYSDTPGDGPKDLYNFDQHNIVKGPKPANLSEKPKDAIASSNIQFKVASTLLDVKTAGPTEDDILHENGNFWVLRELVNGKEAYRVMENAGSGTHAVVVGTFSGIPDAAQRAIQNCDERAAKAAAAKASSAGGDPFAQHPWAKPEPQEQDEDSLWGRKAFNLRSIKANRGDPLMQPTPTNSAVPGKIPGGVGEVGKVCSACGAKQPSGTMMGAICQYCKQPVKPLNHADAAQQAGAIGKVDSLAVSYFAGVYKAASSDGRVAFASEVKEAIDKLNGTPNRDSVQDKDANLANSIQKDMGQQDEMGQPTQPAPQGQVAMDPTPSTKARPMMGKQVPQEIGPKADGTPVGQAMAGGGRQEDQGPHIDGRSLDEFLSTMAGSGRHDEEHKDMMESMGLGPDPVRRPQ